MPLLPSFLSTFFGLVPKDSVMDSNVQDCVSDGFVLVGGENPHSKTMPYDPSDIEQEAWRLKFVKSAEAYEECSI